MKREQGNRGLSSIAFSSLIFSIVILHYPPHSTAAEPAWPKQVHKFDQKEFAPRAGYKLPPGIETRDKQYEPSIAKWDLDGDGKPELILSYVHTPGQNKICYYIFRKENSEYRLIGKIYHCGLNVLEPFNGFGQLEGWVAGSEGVYVRALYQMCSDGAYKNTRIDIYKATRFTDDGGPLASSKVFDYTQYPNTCK